MATGNWSNDLSVPFLASGGVILLDASVETRNWSGGDDPIRHKRPNGYNMSYTRAEDRKFTYINNGIEYTNTPATSSHFNGNLPALTEWSSYDDNVLYDKLLGKINGHQFNLGISIAEAHQTFDLIKNAAKSIDKSLRALKKGNIPAAFRAFGLPVPHYNKTGYANDISDLWLQLQFGWLPLVKDVSEAGKAVKQHIYPPVQQSFSASRRVHDSTTVDGINSSTWILSKSTSKRLAVHLSEPPSDESSLGLTDPASVAWEKVPYSFVVDWFIPIGTYLQNRSQIPALSTDSVITTTKIDSFWGCASVASAVTKVTSYQTDFSLQRAVSTSFPPVRFTSFKHTALNISARHAADAIALMVNNHGRK